MLISDKERLANFRKASPGGKAASAAMTDAQKIERAKAGGLAVASKMTAKERSDRARKAALARHSAKNKVAEG